MQHVRKAGVSDTGDLIVRYKLDVDAYHRMAGVDVFGPEDRVELIDGELIDMAPIGIGHAASVDGLNRTLVIACGDRAVVSVQNPVRLDRLNEPQPDFTVSRPRADSYWTGRPGPADILLLIEIADSSLRFDRTIKLPLYARAGVPELWIVDLKRRILDAYRQPEGDGYAEMTSYGPEDTIGLELAPEITMTLSRAFG